jgi:hypothetical protein
MKTIDLIIFEIDGRWAAALRQQFARTAGPNRMGARLHEVRSIRELNDRLHDYPNCCTFLEVRPQSIGEMLIWLEKNGRAYPRGCFVALFDGTELDTAHWNLAADALLAAGAATIADSPRRLQLASFVCERHVALQQAMARINDGDNQSFSDWAWSLLPWQRAQPPVG